MGAKVCTYEYMFPPPPLFGLEKEWSNGARLPLYLAGLAWTFLGIAIISDIFMAGIEKVTSLKKRVRDKETGRTVTVHLWNATVANLTLMALGSSAPEILLSIIEIVGNEMYLGDLGAGTIVGSAAFNLLCISAVCVLAIDDGEVRGIKEVPVYIITASCSVLAYLWLIIVLMAPPSPNVCESWEAVLTLLFFPILVIFAYLADRGYFNFMMHRNHQVAEKEMTQVIPENVTKDELAQIEQQIREHHGANLSPEQVVSIMTAKYFTQRSRAYYRHAAMQQTLGMKKVDTTSASAADTVVTPTVDTYDSLDADRKQVVIGFASARYAFLEDCGNAEIILGRKGPSHVRASVKYRTRDGTALAGSDYEAREGTIIFEPEETRKVIHIKIHDDNAYEENEEFYVDLYEPTCEADNSTAPEAILDHSHGTVTVVIIDDDEPGVLKFQTEEMTVEEGVEQTICNVKVERLGGASGNIGCRYYTEDMGAIAPMDYKEAAGKIALDGSVQSVIIPITIMPKGRYDKSSGFNVVLVDPVGCKFDLTTDGGEECCICHVIIKGNTTHERKTLIERMETRINSRQAMLGHKHWRHQFYAAIFLTNEDDDDDEDPPVPTKFDYFMHIISVPWKLLFACVPPVDFCGGWACFFGALCMIAVVTAIVGDMANLVGCTLGINPEITAITFVALGTSLPDTFASKAAASMDPHADASIGNITGSNSVNVFLGLGLSWSLAAFYWEGKAADQDWLDKVYKPGGIYYDVRDSVNDLKTSDKAVFVVPAGSLWFNLMVFVLNAFFAIQHLNVRRRKWGGELGGPKNGFMGQYFSAVFLVAQWMIYIIASSIFAVMKES